MKEIPLSKFYYEGHPKRYFTYLDGLIDELLIMETIDRSGWHLVQMMRSVFSSFIFNLHLRKYL